MSDGALAAALAVFDEAALIALANKGVVRRAARDVVEGKVAIVGFEGGGAVIDADGATVRIGPGGPAKAGCSCPAPGVCRHRVAAVLLLQGGAEAPPSEEDALPKLLAEIAAIPEETMRRFAGRAGWRAALEMAEAGAEVEADGTALRIRLADPPFDIRYLPGLGLAGMVSKVKATRLKAVHVAALIAARRSAGIEPEAAVETEAQAEAKGGPDPAYLEEIRSALAEACRTALSLAPIALEERLFTLSVSSRADNLPRLGAMLRGIARMIRDRRERSFRFDPDHCLGQIATADAIARALLAGEGRPGREGLLGSVRQSYAEAGPLRLRGFGAESWRSEGGARGVTAFFYDEEQDRWMTASIARGAGQDPGFDPHQAYAHERIWSGQSLASVAGAELRFEAMAVSEQGRLATSKASGPTVDYPEEPPPDEWLCVSRDWTALTARLHERLSGTLSAPPPAMDIVVLRPRRTLAPYFDDLGQALTWPVEDESGQWLALSIPHDPGRVDRLDPLAALLGSEWRGDVVAAATASGTRYHLRPIALADGRGVASIDLDSLPKPVGARISLRGIRTMLQRRRSDLAPAARPASAHLLDQIRGALTGLAELGCQNIAASQDGALASLGARASRAGLETAAEAVERVRTAAPAELPASVLAACYAVDRLRSRLAMLPLLRRR